ncbi:glycerol-3-phosphate 1-O-acyltransferase PlsY [Marinicrinis lubricantis]|uniref:Glycerol-3-phosphate acyltransferase n=1 Tax=Marinicrinis lubricantis TaxID=2086470 RepID=A0ABW1ITJ1_9BACL
MQTVWPVIVGYLLGAISFSFLIGKWYKGIDIRKHGSGNAGATNTLRVLGKGPAIAVLALDILKGVAAVLISFWIAPDESWSHALTGLAVIAGHNWPVYFGFRGGKGIATTIGVAFTLFPLPALCAGILAIGAIFLTSFVSLGSLIFTGLLPIFCLVFTGVGPKFWLCIVIGILAYIRHRSNIVKLVQGRENKLGSKREESQ